LKFKLSRIHNFKFISFIVYLFFFSVQFSNLHFHFLHTILYLIPFSLYNFYFSMFTYLFYLPLFILSYKKYCHIPKQNHFSTKNKTIFLQINPFFYKKKLFLVGDILFSYILGHYIFCYHSIGMINNKIYDFNITWFTYSKNLLCNAIHII